MTHDRRTFLKTTSLAGVAAVAEAISLPAATDAAAQAAPQAGERREMPKGMIFATLRRGEGFGLGLRTDRGILDVVAAEEDFRAGAPTTIDAMFKGHGDIDGLRGLVDKARTSASAGRYFVAVDKATFGPCVTNPEKIICIGLNYRRHIAEMNAQVPAMPVLFSKYNSALNNQRGTINVSEADGKQFDYEAELVIVIGRTARNVSESDAANYIFGYCTGNDFTARDLQRRSKSMADRQEPGWVGACRAMARHRRPRRRRQSQDRVQGQRRGPPVLEHRRHGLQLQAALELHLEVFHVEAGGHHLYRHARGRDCGISQGQAGLAQGW